MIAGANRALQPSEACLMSLRPLTRQLLDRARLLGTIRVLRNRSLPADAVLEDGEEDAMPNVPTLPTEDIVDPRVFGRKVDFGRAADDYAKHRAGFPPRFYERLTAQLGLRPGMRALDIGTGTGTVARGLAALGLTVDGLDPSEALMEQARALGEAEGVQVAYTQGKAEALPFADASFDLVTAATCWHWFDWPVAAREAVRVLKPGGALVICHFDWIPLPGNLVEATEDLIRAYSPDWNLGRGYGVYGFWLADLSNAGFRDLETASFDHDQPYTHEGWRGRIRASAGVKGSLDAEAVERFDRDHAAMLADRWPDEPLAVLHRVWWVSARKPQ
jgi:SAM-dependent methyltransferase